MKGEHLVPKGEYWRIESVVTRGEDKIEFEINDELYILLYEHHIGISDDFLPFTIPEETKFSMKPIEWNFIINIAVLKKK
ncbi:MAG: hypothetical protein R6V23_13560 [Bacteroidales bacterium]